MTPSQILKSLRRRIVPLAARGLSAAEMRRELTYTLRRFKLSEKVTSALLERVEGELSYVAPRTAAPDTRRAAVEIVRPFAGPVSRLDGALLQQFERRVLPLVEKGARVADVEARIRRAVGATEVSAKTLASTVVAGADRAGSLLAAQEAGVTHYRYAGPPGERHFCSHLYARSAAGEAWTLEQIRAMSNGQGLPVEFYCGGYRCRHRWVSSPPPKKGTELFDHLAPRKEYQRRKDIAYQDASGGFVLVHDGHRAGAVDKDAQIAKHFASTGYGVVLLAEHNNIVSADAVHVSPDGSRYIWDYKTAEQNKNQKNTISKRD